MDHDAAALRGDAPTLFTSVLHGDGMAKVVNWVREAIQHRRWTPATSTARPDHHDHPHPHQSSRSSEELTAES
jgi:urease accessory protein